MVTTPDTATLEYYQSIYTHCKQRFNIPDGIEVVKKSVYQYIENCINNYLFGNYNISEVRSNLYNNLVHYSQLGTEDLNSETLATYFQKLNFNIIEYCEEKYPVQSKYSFDFESETKTSNKGKQKLKQYLRTTPNTSTLQKTTAKHLQTSEQGTSVKLLFSITLFPISLVQPQTPSLPLSRFSRPEDFQSPRNPTQQQEPISTSANIIDYLQENESNHSESLESKETESEPEKITENEKEMATAYIAKIPEFTGKDNDTSPQEWLDKVQKAGDTNGWIAARMLKAIPYFLQGTAGEWFENLEESFENWQAFKDAFLQQFTNNNTSITFRNCFHNIKQETSESFITGLKDKLIKKICPHAPADLATAIRHAKSYEMTMEEANHTKLVNLAIGETSSAAEKKIDQLTKKQQYQQSLPIQPYQTPPTQQYQVPARRLVQHNQFTSQNQLQNNHNRINSNNQLVPRNSGQQRSNYYHTQPSYLTIPEKSNFQQTALSEDKVAVLRSNSFNHIISPVQIAQNANLLDIFPFEFEANKSPFLFSNAAVNEQKAITAMYTEATVEGKPICLILDSGLAGSIITYQLMQQLKRNIDRPAQTVIVTADGMKKTPIGEIDDFSFSIDGITIPVKVLVMDAPQYQALVRNDWLFKANANLNWETQELKISYQGQYTIVPATCTPIFEFEEEKEMPLTETYMALGSTSNWIFKESRGWKKVRYSTPESRKQPPYIPLKCKDCNKKLSSMRACISPEEEYKTRTCYFCKACHRERFGSPKRKMLPEEYNWIDVAMRGGVCDQTCQYALSISEKVRRETPFDAAYNSAFNKLYHYPHNAEMIFDLAMALINGATQEDVHQIKEVEYIEYTIKLAGFDYEDECLECYALSIPLPDENNENEIEFGVSELVEELPTIPIYLLKKQLPLQLKYFDNHSQGIRPEKAHKIDAKYDLRYSGKDTLILQPKFLTKINLKIALEIPAGAMIQIASRSSLASKGINIRRGVIDAGYTGDITIMLQNETDKLFKIEHAEKIAQAIYLSLINISGLQSVNNREQLGKSERGTQDFGSTGRFIIPVNIVFNIQNESHQILQLPQPITILPFGEHYEIYTCSKPPLHNKSLNPMNKSV
ncbi:hypothetical protein G9A89_011580 [Geosiphon pyriformis]|nr:hypothetical protein G9A89_011580 [Geosiphon pyriformis]